MEKKKEKVFIKIGNSKDSLLIVHLLAQMVYKYDDVSPLEYYKKLYERCPEAFIFVCDAETRNLVGYVISLPLEHNYFLNTLKPDFTEECLTPDKVLPYKKGNNDIYFFSIVIDPTYQHRVSALGALSRTLATQYRNFVKQGIYVTKVSALALSESGQKICHGLKMKVLGQNSKGVVFYHDDFYPEYKDEPTHESLLKNFARNRKEALESK